MVRKPKTNIRVVDFSAPKSSQIGGVSAVVLPWRVAENTPQMSDRYPYHVEAPPGVNVRRLRVAHGWSQRQLADKCNPALDHTTVGRLERNEGYTQDTIERVARAMNVNPNDLFLPPELADWPTLPDRTRARIAESVQEAAALSRYRAHKTA